jgi:hypothetical protein
LVCELELGAEVAPYEVELDGEVVSRNLELVVVIMTFPKLELLGEVAS